MRGLHVNFIEISLAPEKISILYNTAVSKEDIWGSCWDPPHQNNKTDLGRPAQVASFRFFFLPFIMSHLLLRFTFSSSAAQCQAFLLLSVFLLFALLSYLHLWMKKYMKINFPQKFSKHAMPLSLVSQLGERKCRSAVCCQCRRRRDEGCQFCAKEVPEWVCLVPVNLICEICILILTVTNVDLLRLRG